MTLDTHLVYHGGCHKNYRLEVTCHAYYLESERNFYEIPIPSLKLTASLHLKNGWVGFCFMLKTTWKGSMAQLPCIGLSYPLTNRHQKLGVALHHLLSVRSSPWKCYTKWSPIIPDFQVILKQKNTGKLETWRSGRLERISLVCCKLRITGSVL